jgi:hypothetical protein
MALCVLAAKGGGGHGGGGGIQKYWNKRYQISIWTMKSNVFFKSFKHSWAQNETPVSGFQQRHSMVIVYK